MHETTTVIPRTRQGVRNLDALEKPVLPFSGGPVEHSSPGVNVGSTERLVSAVGGALLAAYGVSRVSPIGLALAAIGGSLVYRGATGHCALYDALRMNTARAIPEGQEVVYRPG